MTAPGPPQDPTRIPAATMAELLDRGHARPLLDDHFPVPVRLDGRWWHVPADVLSDPDTTGDAVVFVPVSGEFSGQLDRLAARRRAAAHASIAADDATPPPV